MSQTAVLQLASGLPDPATTALLTNALPKPSPALQLGVLGALQQRGDPAATPAVLAALRRPQPEVRAAAAAAMGTLGDASAVAVLAEAATPAGRWNKGRRGGR